VLPFHQIILRKFISLFFILFLIVGGIVYYWLYEYYVESSKKSLLQDIKLIALSINQNSDLDKLAIEIKTDLNLRLTLIDKEGVIIAESHKDKSKMDNHKYRDEIIQASTQEYGYKIRHSKTVDIDLLYVVQKLTIENRIIYIRLAQELSDIKEQIFSLGIKILTALIAFFIAIFMVTYNIHKQIKYETQKIVKFLTSLTKKKKDTYINSEYSQEFALITKLLTKVSQIIVKKEKQKTKFTAKLQISNKQKDDIISAISHEFKNPIAVINGYSQTLLDDAEINPNIRQKFLSKIYKNGLKLSELIDTLRLSSKLDSGQQEMQFKDLKLQTLIEDCVENIKLNYPRREVIINGLENVTIKADASLLGVVITNLVENAFKYSEDEVLINFDENCFSVIDTGIGISKNNLDNITNKFYRVDENSWNNSLGLGLFIVSNILSLHHFKFEITSKENKGSTFSVIF